MARALFVIVAIVVVSSTLHVASAGGLCSYGLASGSCKTSRSQCGSDEVAFTNEQWPGSRSSFDCSRKEVCCLKQMCSFQKGDLKTTYFRSFPSGKGACVPKSQCTGSRVEYPVNNWGRCEKHMGVCCGEAALTASTPLPREQPSRAPTGSRTSSGTGDIELLRCSCTTVHDVWLRQRKIGAPLGKHPACQIKFRKGTMECTVGVKECKSGHDWVAETDKSQATCIKVVW